MSGRLTDREYYDVLRQRAMDIVSEMRRQLDTSELTNEDKRFAPHVTAERLFKVADLAADLVALRGAVR